MMKDTKRRQYGAVDAKTIEQIAELKAWRRSGSAESFREWRKQFRPAPKGTSGNREPRQRGLFGEVGPCS
jgi:hypothetical protein